MLKEKNFNYALFGNPVNYSQSPKIHSLFAKQTKLLHIYKSINVPLDNFFPFMSDFFKKQGKGANITAPFKQKAYLFSDTLTERAKIAQSVNTLKKIDNQCILGDNTDGIGLFSDLMRLKYLKKEYSILILGSGGAVKGVLFSLLSFGCSIFILNRTISNAEKLVLQFNKYGNIQVFNKKLFIKKTFDLVINATSKYTKNIVDFSFFSSKTFFYDMNYKKNETPFLDLCIKKGANFFSNGVGMLVFQAAHSFLLWHNIFPKTDYIINFLNNVSCKK